MRSGDLLGRVFRLGTGDGTWTVSAVTGPTRWHHVTLLWNRDSVRHPGTGPRLVLPVHVFRNAYEYGLIEEV